MNNISEKTRDRMSTLDIDRLIRAYHKHNNNVDEDRQID